MKVEWGNGEVEYVTDWLWCLEYCEYHSVDEVGWIPYSFHEIRTEARAKLNKLKKVKHNGFFKIKYRITRWKRI